MKVGLKLNIQKTKIMAFDPITSWEIDGETVECFPIVSKQWKQWETLFFLVSKITADGDCSHEIKRHLLLGRKAMTNLDGILKSREITLLTKVHLVKAMVFPVVMYGCESWMIKKAECWRIDAFELWCWRRLFAGVRPWWNQGDLKGRRIGEGKTYLIRNIKRLRGNSIVGNFSGERRLNNLAYGEDQ